MNRALNYAVRTFISTMIDSACAWPSSTVNKSCDSYIKSLLAKSVQWRLVCVVAGAAHFPDRHREVCAPEPRIRGGATPPAEQVEFQDEERFTGHRQERRKRRQGGIDCFGIYRKSVI